jgi:hypothetical protein
MKHLEYANQTYLQHFQDSMYYSWISLKACFIFFIHGIFPDTFIDNGSTTISLLNKIIQFKINQFKIKIEKKIDVIEK